MAGDKEYSTTGWVEGADAVQAAAVAPSPPPLASVAGLKPGLLRRASYSGTMMGSKVPAHARAACRATGWQGAGVANWPACASSEPHLLLRLLRKLLSQSDTTCSCPSMLQYRNEELHRLLEAAPGSAYTIMTTVLTTAMHGEKFRWVLPLVPPDMRGWGRRKDRERARGGRQEPGGPLALPLSWIVLMLDSLVHYLTLSACPPCAPCRPVVSSTLRALPDGRTEFRIRTTILFILKPNGFIKAMIDKGGWAARPARHPVAPT